MKDYKSNFALAANFISSSITPSSKGKDCNISSLKQSQHGDHKQRNSNSQLCGRGGQDGHGRGHGRGRGRGGKGASVQETKPPQLVKKLSIRGFFY